MLARKRADAEGLPDPWKHTETPPDPDAPDFGWTTKKKVAAGAVSRPSSQRSRC